MNIVLIILNETLSFLIYYNVFKSICYLRNGMRFRPAGLGMLYDLDFFFMPIQIFIMTWLYCHENEMLIPKLEKKYDVNNHYDGHSLAFHELVVGKSFR